MQRAHARLMTRTLLHMHRHIQTHTHTMGGELQTVGLDSRALLQAAPRQCQCGSRNRLSGTGQAGKCSVRMPCASCMAMGRMHGSQSPEHSTHASKR